MQAQQPLSDIHRKRIQNVAMGHEQTVELLVRHGSGKTLELLVVIPGVKALTHFVVRLHRRFHKEFYRIAAAAKEWLGHYKALFAPVIPATALLLPAQVGVKSTGEMLATAKANIKPYNWKEWADKVDAVPATPRSGSFYAGSAGKAKRAIATS